MRASPVPARGPAPSRILSTISIAPAARSGCSHAKPPIRIGERSTRGRAAWAASTGEARSARERGGALGALLLVGLEARCSSRQGAGMRHGLVVGCEARGIGVFGRRTRSIEALSAPAALARGRDAAAELGPLFVPVTVAARRAEEGPHAGVDRLVLHVHGPTVANIAAPLPQADPVAVHDVVLALAVRPRGGRRRERLVAAGVRAAVPGVPRG